MATLDQDRGVLIVRVVYDGPPRAGKTTSLRTLASLVDDDERSSVYSPGEMDGRTRYFDWMLYRAGRLDGYRVFCQVMSVPGQTGLAERRRILVKAADAVIFVANTRGFDMPGSLTAFAETKQFLAGAQPPIGMVLQANKRDLPGSVPMAEVRARLGGDDPFLAFIPCVATSGQGVLDAFNLAVRLALDRAQVLLDQGSGFDDMFGVRSGEDLLRALERATGSLPLGMAQDDAAESTDETTSDAAQRVSAKPGRSATADPTNATEPPPALPDAAVPTGCIRPPIAGRILLQRLGAAGLAPLQAQEGGWHAFSDDGWRVVSAADHDFGSSAEGRSVLLSWARMLASLGPRLSSDRAVVLAETGRETWRLWQIIVAHRSIADELAGVFGAIAESSFGEQLAAVARRYQAAVTELDVPPRQMPLDPDAVGFEKGRACHVGLAPPQLAQDAPEPTPADAARPTASDRLAEAVVEVADGRGIAREMLVARLASSTRAHADLDGLLTATLARLEDVGRSRRSTRQLARG